MSLSFVLVFLSRKMKVVCPSAKSNLKYNDEGEKEYVRSYLKSLTADSFSSKIRQAFSSSPIKVYRFERAFIACVKKK